MALDDFLILTQILTTWKEALIPHSQVSRTPSGQRRHTAALSVTQCHLWQWQSFALSHLWNMVLHSCLLVFRNTSMVLAAGRSVLGDCHPSHSTAVAPTSRAPSCQQHHWI